MDQQSLIAEAQRLLTDMVQYIEDEEDSDGYFFSEWETNFIKSMNESPTITDNMLGKIFECHEKYTNRIGNKYLRKGTPR